MPMHHHQLFTATAPDGVTIPPYLSPDSRGFAVVAVDVEAVAGSFAADVDGSTVEIITTCVAKAKTKAKAKDRKSVV